MAKSISNKNTVSYEAKFLKKIFSKLSHSPSKVEIGGDGGGGMNSESKANGGVKYSVERKLEMFSDLKMCFMKCQCGRF